jgi:hypothetical protein
LPPVFCEGDPRRSILLARSCQRLITGRSPRPNRLAPQLAWTACAGGVLLSGRAGCGKDSLIAPALWAICGPFQRNRGLVDSDQLNNQWGYHMEAEVLILNELKDTDGAARRALANKLKPLLAAPPEYLSVNRKGLKPYDALNRLLPIAFSNEQVPLVIDSTDRRWFALRSTAKRMDAADAARLWGWYADGGFDAVAELLWTRDVSKFNPGAAPMKKYPKPASLRWRVLPTACYPCWTVWKLAWPFRMSRQSKFAKVQKPRFAN